MVLTRTTLIAAAGANGFTCARDPFGSDLCARRASAVSEVSAQSQSMKLVIFALLLLVAVVVAQSQEPAKQTGVLRLRVQ